MDSMKRKLESIGFEFFKYERGLDLLKNLLKVLLSDKTASCTKLDILIFIEEQHDYLLSDADAVKLTITAFRSILKSPVNESNAVVQGQSLVSLTTILLAIFQSDDKAKDSSYLVTHTEYLLIIVCQTNIPKSISLRSMAANCLMEIELCIPGILHECLDVVYTATVFETSIAHQAYLELLSVLMCHSRENFSFSPDIPQLRVPENLLEGCSVIRASPNSLSSSELEQMIGFALDQLPMLSTSACVHVAARMATLMQALNEIPPSLASAHMLQPVLQQYLCTHSLTACQLILNLECQYGTSEHFKDDFYRQSIVEHLTSCCSNPGLPVASRLIFIDWLEEFLTRHPDRVKNISDIDIVPQMCDGTHTRLKKIKLLTSIYKQKGISSGNLLGHIMSLHQQIKSKNASVKVKAAFIKALYCATRHVGDELEEEMDVVPRLLAECTLADITFSPFLVNFMHHSGDAKLESRILVLLLPQLLSNQKKQTEISHTMFECTLEIMKQAVATRDPNISRPKDMLSNVTENLEKLNSEINAATGHQVLSLCHKIMKLFDAREFLEEMEKLLITLTEKSSEDDVQNRAHSYKALLACLSDTKVKEVLKAQKKSVSQLMVTEGMFHKPEALIMLEKHLITLHKFAKLIPKAVATEDVEGSSDYLEDSNMLAIYKQHIINEAATKPILIPCAVSLTTFVQEDMLPIEALVIFLTPCNAFGKIEPLLVGNISKKLMSFESTEVITTMKYVVTKPYPVMINARSEFSLNNVLHTSPMETFKIEFIDLFQPLPTPGHICGSQHDWRKLIFPKLWELMQDIDSNGYHLATTVIQRHVSHVRSKIKHELKPFVICKGAHEASIGIYLVPSNHILIKTSFSENSAIFRIATDDIFLLAHINDYFSQW